MYAATATAAVAAAEMVTFWEWVQQIVCSTHFVRYIEKSKHDVKPKTDAEPWVNAIDENGALNRVISVTL